MKFVHFEWNDEEIRVIQSTLWDDGDPHKYNRIYILVILFRGQMYIWIILNVVIIVCIPKKADKLTFFICKRSSTHRLTTAELR